MYKLANNNNQMELFIKKSHPTNVFIINLGYEYFIVLPVSCV